MQIVNRKEYWTIAKLKDELFSELSKVPITNKSFSVKDKKCIFLNDLKYYAQARELIYWIPITRPKESPPFVINLSDLSCKCKEEFLEYCSVNDTKEIGLLLKEVVTKFFENINRDYTHNSVPVCLKLKWRIEMNPEDVIGREFSFGGNGDNKSNRKNETESTSNQDKPIPVLEAKRIHSGKVNVIGKIVSYSNMFTVEKINDQLERKETDARFIALEDIDRLDSNDRLNVMLFDDMVMNYVAGEVVIVSGHMLDGRKK